MWQRYAWFAYPAFGSCLVAGVASYLWDDDYLWWPVLFGVIGCAVMAPLLVVRPTRDVLEVFRSGSATDADD
jgi:hypothetical protein